MTNKNLRLIFFSFFMILLLVGCDDNNGTIDISNSDRPNILLIIADDMGKDTTHGYTEGIVKPNTPHINKIRDEGLMFNNFWVNPTCSPTRSSIITGKYGYRTGVKVANDELVDTDNLLQKYISDETNNSYATAVIGKWHLSGDNAVVNPEDYGIDYYAGLIRGGLQDYYQWQLTEDLMTTNQTEYSTTVFTDLSINWLEEQDQPWFLWLAYNAPHTPFHNPPTEMHSQGELPTYEEGLDPTPYFMAAIETMDYQIGRLLDSIPEDELENTIIIFIGDNGTPNQVAQSPYSNSTVKGSLYQGGISVPMFISGQGVSRFGEDESIICSTDLYSTIAAIAGVNNSEIYDSKSFKTLLTQESSHRNFQYSDKTDDIKDSWAISNGSFKLIQNELGDAEFYDLINDPYESTDLMLSDLSNLQEIEKLALEAELLVIRN